MFEEAYDDITTANNFTTTVKPFPPIPLTKFAGICVCVFGVIGILANGLVLTVIGMTGKKSFSTYKYFISHLALADLLASVMSMVYFPLELHNHNWIYAGYSCKFIYPSITFFETISCGTIIMISIERYKYVILPHSSPWRRYHVILALSIVWLSCFILVLPNIIAIKITHYAHDFNYCNENWDKINTRRTNWQQIYGISFFMFAYLVPCIAILIMHSHILVKLRMRPQPSNDSDHRTRNDRRIKRVLTGIIVAFFLCISPNKFLYLVWDVRPDLEKSLKSHARLYLRIPYLFYYMRVAVDPLIYCFFDTRFKRDLSNNKIIIFLMALLGKSTGKSNRNRARTVSTQASITMSATLSVDPSSLVLSHIHSNGVGVANGNGRCGHSNGIGIYRGVSNGHTNGAMVMDESPSFRECASLGDESPSVSYNDGSMYMGEYTASRTSPETVHEESATLTSTKCDDESSYTASEREDDSVGKPRTDSTLTQNTCVYGSGSYTPTDGVLSEQTEF